MIKNNVTRFLESHHIVFKSYESEPVKRSAVESAVLLGVEAHRLYKSIVVKRTERGKPLIVVLPGPATVDLKKVAGLVGEKKVQLATQTEAEKLTGLQVGGISPLALLQKGFHFIVDDSVYLLETLILSGGQRGLSVELAVADLIRILSATVGDVKIAACDENQLSGESCQ